MHIRSCTLVSSLRLGEPNLRGLHTANLLTVTNRSLRLSSLRKQGKVAVRKVDSISVILCRQQGFERTPYEKEILYIRVRCTGNPLFLPNTPPPPPWSHLHHPTQQAPVPVQGGHRREFRIERILGGPTGGCPGTVALRAACERFSHQDVSRPWNRLCGAYTASEG